MPDHSKTAAHSHRLCGHVVLRARRWQLVSWLRRAMEGRQCLFEHSRSHLYCSALAFVPLAVLSGQVEFARWDFPTLAANLSSPFSNRKFSCLLYRHLYELVYFQFHDSKPYPKP